ncbi:MAG: RNA polymerase sigma factor FliA [Chromatiales bacterium]|nr:RNA polymerase sigma factor FliA [Gammaproteobacteria bacterium]MCP5352804.1 RNA polymerase sigma factor FliA [Chromatiales bacterium]
MNAVKNYLDVKQGTTEQLVLGHQKLVQQIAHHLHARLPASVQVDDLIQSGMEALLEAAANYDSATGVPFEAYARLRVRGSMIDELRRGNWAPRSIHAKSRAIAEAVSRLQAEGDDANDDRRVAEEAGLSLNEYYRVVSDATSTQVLSLDEMPFESKDSLPDDDLAEPSQATEKEQLVRMLAGLIPRLPERERLVITLYYHEELNQREIAEVLGVTESRVSQIHGQALLKMRGMMKGDEMRHSRQARLIHAVAHA